MCCHFFSFPVGIPPPKRSTFYLLFINSLLTSRKFAKRIVYCLQKEIARNAIYLSVHQSLSNLNEEDCYKCYGVSKKHLT